MPYETETLAAVDLGSHSFYLLIGRVAGDRMHTVGAWRERVRLADGLQSDGLLDAASQARALAALARFGEHLQGFSPRRARAVGTSALRAARNATAFQQAAQDALGLPVEVLGGEEEARLVYLGVTHVLGLPGGRRLVMDIGGGSTEFALGTHVQPRLARTLPLGCVSHTARSFPDGVIDWRSMGKAIDAAVEAMRIAAPEFENEGWDEAVASSGLACNIARCLAQVGWGDGRYIEARALAHLRDHLIRSGTVAAAGLTTSCADHAPILPGGVAIMSAAFEVFAFPRIRASEAALRHGVLHELTGGLAYQLCRSD